MKKVATWWQYNWAFVSRVLRIAMALVVVAVVVEEHREPMSTLEAQEEVLNPERWQRWRWWLERQHIRDYICIFSVFIRGRGG